MAANPCHRPGHFDRAPATANLQADRSARVESVAGGKLKLHATLRDIEKPNWSAVGQMANGLAADPDHRHALLPPALAPVSRFCLGSRPLCLVLGRHTLTLSRLSLCGGRADRNVLACDSLTWARLGHFDRRMLPRDCLHRARLGHFDRRMLPRHGLFRSNRLEAAFKSMPSSAGKLDGRDFSHRQTSSRGNCRFQRVVLTASCQVGAATLGGPDSEN